MNTIPGWKIPRRRFVKSIVCATTALPVTLVNNSPVTAAEPPGVDTARGRLSVVCVGGHPDDPESGCSGTLARYAGSGHRVTVIYLTRGERGIQGKDNDQAAQIRSAECEAACQIMGARPVFAGQIDGSTEFNRARADEFQKVLSAEHPDIVFTHWPIDTHTDHQMASILAFRSCLGLARSPQVYFFEVNTGSQSLGFAPNTYIDVTTVLEKKKAALLAHQSQGGEEIWRKHHEIVATFRGRESGVRAAEAFFHLDRTTPATRRPGL